MLYSVEIILGIASVFVLGVVVPALISAPNTLLVAFGFLTGAVAVYVLWTVLLSVLAKYEASRKPLEGTNGNTKETDEEESF